MKLPRRFIEECEAVRQRQAIRGQHLLLLHHEGLHLLERWQTERHWRSPRETETYK